MKKVRSIISGLLCIMLCLYMIPAFAESDTLVEMNGVYLEYSFSVSESRKDEAETLFNAAFSMLQERFLEKGYTIARICAIDGGIGIRLELRDVTDPVSASAEIGSAAVLSFRYEDGTEFLTNKNVKSVTAEYDEDKGYYIALELDSEGAEIFAEATKKSINHTIGIYLDEELLMCPFIGDAIYGGNIAITGMFTEEQANEYALMIQAGALPFQLTLVRSGTIWINP